MADFHEHQNGKPGRYFLPRIFATLVVFYLPGLLIGQLTTVSGVAEHRPGELVRVIMNADQFSRLETTLASAYTDESGAFSLRFELPSTAYATFSIGLERGEFYLSPGGSYELFVPMTDHAEPASVFDELPLQFVIREASDSLNEVIGNFNNTYNNFLLENLELLTRGRDRSMVTDFILQMEENYGKVEYAYFQDYLAYSKAALEWLSRMKTNAMIIDGYFAARPLLPGNIQYADFFSDFFRNHFASGNYFSYTELVDAINSGRGFIEVDRLIMNEEKLEKDPLLRELIGILLIARKYHSPDVRKQNVVSLLSEIERNSQSRANGLVAGNMIRKLKTLAYGTMAPPFELENAKGQMTALSDFTGRFKVLYFTRSGCKVCMYYFQDLDRLRKEFAGRLEIIVISDAEGYPETLRYAGDRSYDWPILNLDKEILLLEQYGVKAYPAVILINPNNTIASVNAPLPQEGLDLFIRRYMERYSKKYPADTED